jgi:hypothetical protein
VYPLLALWVLSPKFSVCSLAHAGKLEKVTLSGDIPDVALTIISEDETDSMLFVTGSGVELLKK